MRTLTGNAAIQTALKNGAKPIMVLKISWPAPTGDLYYADETMIIQAIPVKGALNQISSLNIQQKEAKNQAEYNASSLASASVVLNDIDGTLKTLFDTVVLEHTSATLYQYFEGLLIADLITLVSGKIFSPIVWSEGDRTLRFDIVSKLEDLSVPYASDGTDIPLIFPDAIGKPFPMCFGNPINVPALKLYGAPKGTLIDPITSETVPGTQIHVNNASAFPQGVSIDVVVGNAIFTGIFSAGNIFTVSVINKPKYTNVRFDARPILDPDHNDPKVGYLVDPKINLVGYNCWVNVQQSGSNMKVPQLNYCWKQVGTKCFFINNWIATNGNNILVSNLNNEQIDEVAVLMRQSWGAGTILWNFGFNWHYTTTFISWWYSAGSRMTISGVPDVYIANQIPSNAIVDVLAFKKIDGEKGDMLLSIPPAYYTVDLGVTALPVIYNGVATNLMPTRITFSESLSDLDNTWKDDQIYVTVKSTVGSNTSDQIKYLIDNFTGLTSDATSFSTVQGYLAKYPSNFALLTVENVLKVIQEIAWQARCGIRVEGNSVSIVYLSRRPASLLTVDSSLVKLKSLYLSTSEVEQVFTQITGLWRDVYMSDDITRKRAIQTTPSLQFERTQGEEFILLYKNNINRYGLRKLEYRFYIYNIQSLVQKSLNFWGHRLSNIFREVRLTQFLNILNLELFDALTFGLADASLVGSIIGTIEEQSLDPDNYTIGMKVGLASLAGTKIEDPAYWVDDSTDITPVDPVLAVVPTNYTYYIVTDFNKNPLNDPTKTAQSGAIALGEINTVNSTTDYLVDIYDDGYGNAITRAAVDCTLIGPTANLQVGDQVIVHSNTLGSFIHSGGGASNVATAKVAWNQDVTVASAGGLTLDTIPLVEGDIVLLFNQTNPANNKRWTVHTVAGSGSDAWSSLDQPDACIIKQGVIWVNYRFTLTGANVYTPVLDNFTTAYAATHKNIASIGSITGALTSTGGADGTAVAVNNLLAVINQTTPSENGLYMVLTGTWVKIGQPEKISIQNGKAYKGLDIVLTGVNIYTPQLHATILVDKCTTVATAGTYTGTQVVDGQNFTSGYVLLTNEGPNTKNGIWFNYNDASNWAFLGQPLTVKVKESTFSNGQVNNSRKYFLASVNNYVRYDVQTVATVAGFNAGALPAAQTLSDGTVLTLGNAFLHTGAGTRGVYVLTASGVSVFDATYPVVAILTGVTAAQIFVYNGFNYQLSYAAIHA